MDINKKDTITDQEQVLKFIIITESVQKVPVSDYTSYNVDLSIYWPFLNGFVTFCYPLMWISAHSMDSWLDYPQDLTLCPSKPEERKYCFSSTDKDAGVPHSLMFLLLAIVTNYSIIVVTRWSWFTDIITLHSISTSWEQSRVEWVGEWVGEWVSEWVSGWVSEWVSESIGKWVDTCREWLSRRNVHK